MPRPTELPFAEFGNRQAPSRADACVATVIRFASGVLVVLFLVSMSHAETMYPAGGSTDSRDSLSCSGGLVLIGDSKSTVYEKCGPPQHIDKGCARGLRHGSLRCWDIWMYRPNASYFPRYVSFVNDTVAGIQAGSRFD